ncbi:MAG: type II secretion system F family protein [Candidatus Aenigmatarchaeota archaeon]
MMQKTLKITIPASILVAIIIFFIDLTSLIPVFLMIIFIHIGIFGYEMLKKELEISLSDRYFLVFLKNLSRSVEVGIAPIKALIEISKEKYGEITKHFRVFKRKLEAGIDIDSAFEYLMNTFKRNRKIFNSLRILNFELKSGYAIKDAIDSLYEYIIKIGEVEREKKSVISQFTVMFYAVSIIFAVIILILVRVLAPVYSQLVTTSQNVQPICLDLGVIYSFRDLICKMYLSEAYIFKKDFKETEAYMFSVLFNISILQAIFSGIIIGYGAEKSIAKSLIHAAILFIIIFSLFFISGKLGLL